MNAADDARGVLVPARPAARATPAGAPVTATPRLGPVEIGPRRPAEQLAVFAANAGLRRIEIVAWRDLEHPEAGGSELHAARIAERWAAAGIDVQLTASRAPGAPRHSERDGYRTWRPARRYLIFPTVGATRLAHPRRQPDGVVEIWNGMPFFSPLWAQHPRLVFLHHVHGGMWHLALPPKLARAGQLIEQRLAPPFYADTPVITLSESSRRPSGRYWQAKGRNGPASRRW
jgi:hypothetical protein